MSPLGSKHNFLCLYCVAATQFNPSNWHICLIQNNDFFLCLLVQKHEEPGSRHSSHQNTQSFFWKMGTSEDLCCKMFSLDGGHVGIVILARVSRQERQTCSCNFRIFLWKQSTDLAMRGGTEKKKKVKYQVARSVLQELFPYQGSTLGFLGRWALNSGRSK